ncbi:CHAT domain-containing protein [Aquimarina brevivitae]|uniref:Tetratricopeptide repeat protein n=1 Tax=Aquimarina brevivitae TaxID=323412 RepID=A0A4V2F5K6_9FLAO|nr:CHAT domain-containing protein [Aquimarina brevivitae]RZS93149.1 tetratricopeptide repeat protein [Aquimarina brevivitae]
MEVFKKYFIVQYTTKNVRRRPLFPFLHFFTFLLISYTSFAQDISTALDIILSSTATDSIKKIQYTQLFNHYKIDNNFKQLGDDAHELGKYYYRKKDKDNTILYTKLAIDAKKKAVPFDEQLLKNSYLNLGFAYKKYEQYDKAIVAITKAVPFKNKKLNIIGYGYLSEIYDILEDPYNAVENQLKIFEFLDPKVDQEKIIKNHIEVAFSYRNMGQKKTSKEVIRHLLTADSLSKLLKEPNQKDSYLILLNLGVQYHERGDEDYLISKNNKNLLKAINYYKKSLTIAEELEHKGLLSSTYYNLGLAHVDVDTDKAITFFNKSLELVDQAPHLLKLIYFGNGKVAYKKGNYTKAIQCYKQSIEAFFDAKEKRPNWQPNQQQLNAVKEKSELLEVLKAKVEAHIDNAGTTKDATSYHNALATLDLADNLIELMLTSDASPQTKLQWRDLASEIYILGLEACYQGNLLEKGFYLMEKNKSLLLMKDLNIGKAKLPEALLRRELEFKNSISFLQEEKQTATGTKKDAIAIAIFDKKEELRRFHDSISHYYPGYFVSRKMPDVLPLSKVNVKSNEIIIQFAMAERMGYTTPYAYGMIISKDQNKLYKINNIATLIDDIKTLRGLLDKPFQTIEDQKNYNAKAFAIYQNLFPAELRRIVEGKKVTIITDHVLNFIPFEALLTNTDQPAYLIEQCQIAYAYSLSFLEKNSSLTRKPEHDLFGVAPLKFSNNLAALPSSKQELEAIENYYSGSLLLENQATKENFITELNKYKIIHLATHADASDQVAPWIAFRNEKLTELELNSLQSQAELVVLSACNTSIGEIRRGEGVLSLARGFFKSGAHTVIPTLWSTNDKTTAEITKNFYKHLSEGATKPEALHKAKLEYLKNHKGAEASPHYWASLILIGDTGQLLPQHNYQIILLCIGLCLIIIFLTAYIYQRRKK